MEGLNLHLFIFGETKVRYIIGNRAKLLLWQKVLLGLLPIVLIISWYHFKSMEIDGVYNNAIDKPRQELTAYEKEVRSLYKILPTYSRMWDGIVEYSTKNDRKTGEPKTFTDVKSSLNILVSGILITTAVAILFGILAGTFPIIEAIIMPTINIASIIPPPATVPLLFVAFTPGFELSVVIIFIFLFFVLTKDIVHQLKGIPLNLNTQFFTKGASELEIAKGNFKMIIPGILKSLQMSLPMAWVGVYFAETLGVQAGLGFRTFLLKRFMAHDIIIPYILIVTILALIFYFGIELVIKYKYRWYQKG